MSQTSRATRQRPEPELSAGTTRSMLYLMGTANCGSTLLTRLLANHPEIATIGELKASAINDIQTYVCGCGTLFTQCRFWKDVAALCSARGFEFDINNFGTRITADDWLSKKALTATIRGPLWEALRSAALRIVPPVSTALARSIERNAILIDAVCQHLNKSVFLDGSKDPTRAVHFSRSGRFTTKVIHLVRDGRAVVASYRKRHTDHGNNIHLWKSKLMECERAKRLLNPVDVLTLRYEDFCNDAEATLGHVFAFASLSSSDDVLRNDLATPHHIIGHNSRLNTVGPIRERAEWRTTLTKSEIEHFESQGGAVNRRYGYQD